MKTMRLILLAAVLVLGVLECESVSFFTRKRGRCGDAVFRDRQIELKKYSGKYGNAKRKQLLCRLAKQLTRRCFLKKKMSTLRLFQKWFSQCMNNIKKPLHMRVEDVEEAVARHELFDVVERVEECNNKVNKLTGANYAFVLSEDIHDFSNEKEFNDFYKKIDDSYKKFSTKSSTSRLTESEKKYAENIYTLNTFYSNGKSRVDLTSMMPQINVANHYRPSREYFGVTFVSANMRNRYCLERNLDLIIGEGNVEKMIRKTNWNDEKPNCEPEAEVEAKKKLNNERSSLYDKCTKLFDTRLAGIKSLLHLKFSDEATDAYQTIANAINKNRCEDGASHIDTEKLARSVCMLQARGRGQYDQLGYADNFFRLINDQNMFVSKEAGKFQCKLFKSGGEDTGNFCNTRPEFIPKKLQLGRRLLVAEECKTKYINLKASGNGFGVLKSFKGMSEEPRVQLKVKVLKDTFVAIKETVIEIHYMKGQTTNFLVSLNCKNPEGKIENQVCRCNSDMTLFIFIDGKKTGDCVFKSGPSWEIMGCNTMRRRLLYKSRAGC